MPPSFCSASDNRERGGALTKGDYRASHCGIPKISRCSETLNIDAANQPQMTNF